MDVVAGQASHHDWQYILHLSDQVPRKNIEQEGQSFARVSGGSNCLESPSILSASRYEDIIEGGLSDHKAAPIQLYRGLITDDLPCTNSGYKQIHSKTRHQKLHSSPMQLDVLAGQASHHDRQYGQHLSDQVPRDNIEQDRQSFPQISVGSSSLESLSILSASRYEDIIDGGLSDHKAASVQLYGGLLTDDLPCTDSGYKQIHSKARHQKLHASAMLPDNRKSHGNRQRGRPRLTISNETPAEKRRTQIRVAQRKYRQRKENTIAELKAEVSELHYMLDAMNDSFLRLHDGLYQTELLAPLPSNHRLLCHLQFMRRQSAHISNIMRDTGSDASGSPDN